MDKKVCDQRESVGTQLLDAINHWPTAINVHLCPYALRYDTDVHNMMLIATITTYPFQPFRSAPADANLNNFYAFDCPVYALDSKLAGRQSIGHWNPRAQIGINLGFSSRRARLVYNVLNVTTAIVSSQFHVKMDICFESVSVGVGNAPVTTVW